MDEHERIHLSLLMPAAEIQRWIYVQHSFSPMVVVFAERCTAAETKRGEKKLVTPAWFHIHSHKFSLSSVHQQLFKSVRLTRVIALGFSFVETVYAYENTTCSLRSSAWHILTPEQLRKCMRIDARFRRSFSCEHWRLYHGRPKCMRSD